MQQKHEFEFTKQDFQYLSQLVAENAGIKLSPCKYELVYSRLAKRIRDLRFTSFAEYCERLRSHPELEKKIFINALVTNFTYFFREPHHYQYLREIILPELIKRNKKSKKIKIWSAGCSTGEEAYSIAITVNEFFKHKADWQIEILATDIDTEALQTGKKGLYPVKCIDNLTEVDHKAWFLKGIGINEGLVKVKPEYAQNLIFKEANLMDGMPSYEIFDVIFCCNVIIYFDTPVRSQMINLFADHLEGKGFLILGHSETTCNASKRFQNISKTVYRKIK